MLLSMAATFGAGVDVALCVWVWRVRGTVAGWRAVCRQCFRARWTCGGGVAFVLRVAAVDVVGGRNWGQGSECVRV